MIPIELINSFVAEKLDGEIQRLTDFPLGSLPNDWAYFRPNHQFNSDEVVTELFMTKKVGESLSKEICWSIMRMTTIILLHPKKATLSGMVVTPIVTVSLQKAIVFLIQFRDY